METELSIIIVNWNSLGYLKKCIPTIYADPDLDDFEVIVVDNASHDGAEEFLRKCFPEIKYVQSSENLGFAKANNLGFSRSRGAYLLFLNPDTEIVGHAISRMLSTLRESQHAAIAGPRLLNTDGSLQTSCVQAFPTVFNQMLDIDLLRRIFPRSRLWGSEPLTRKLESQASVEMVSGACLMIRRKAFEEFGGFATDYFMYAEDVDLCYVARLAGRGVLYQGEASVVHHGGGSTKGKRQSRFSAILTRQSLLIFMQKYYGFPHPLLFRVSSFANASIRVMLLSVLSLLAPDSSSMAGPLAKWSGVLRWSLGLEKWAAELSMPANNMGCSYAIWTGMGCAESAEN